MLQLASTSQELLPTPNEQDAGRDVTRTNHLHLVPRLGICGAVPHSGVVLISAEGPYFSGSSFIVLLIGA